MSVLKAKFEMDGKKIFLFSEPDKPADERRVTYKDHVRIIFAETMYPSRGGEPWLRWTSYVHHFSPHPEEWELEYEHSMPFCIASVMLDETSALMTGGQL